MKNEEFVKKQTETSKESHAPDTKVASPSSTIPPKKPEAPVAPKATPTESKTGPMRDVAPTEKKEECHSEKEPEKKAS
jgi:hypothetical protein